VTKDDDRVWFKKPYQRAVCIDNLAIFGVDSAGMLTQPGPNDRYRVSLTIGKVYEISGEDGAMWAILDDTGDVYLFPKSNFRLLPTE
jgi:hypothetical protein